MASVPVGALACQRDSFLRELVATVVSCQPSKAKGGGGDMAAPAGYDLVLSDSVLFPEGGGQPCDHGTVRLLSAPQPGNGERAAVEAHILKVQRRGDTCVLTSPLPFPVGSTVHQEVDWRRRLDHMQHHTAQHLLTAMVERTDTLGLPTFSWSLTHPYCFIQVDLANGHAERAINAVALGRVQALCNAAIARNAAVCCDVFANWEAYQGACAGGDAQTPCRSRGIPEDVSGPIRVITLDGIDACTCCGTHLDSLSKLHVLHLLHQEVKGTLVKLYFITGERAIEHFSAMFLRERALTQAMDGAQPEDFIGTVCRRARETAELEKKLKRWALEELAPRTAKDLRDEVVATARKVVCLRRDDVDLEFFNAVRQGLNTAGLAEVVLVAAWTVRDAAHTTAASCKNPQGQVLVTGAGKDELERVVCVLKDTLPDLRGGMSKQGFRGKGSLKGWDRLVLALSEVSW